MLMTASAEFVNLCQSQVALLTQGLGASLAVVYLTEDLTDALNAKLIPVVAHPEVAATWELTQLLSLFSEAWGTANLPLRLLPGATSSRRAGSDRPDPEQNQARLSNTLGNSGFANPEFTNPDRPPEAAASVHPDPPTPRQIALPLVHEGVVMGLLVTARSDRPWADPEQVQIDRIARTLAIACLLDQRGQWLQHNLQQQEVLLEQQRDIFDNLLHQLRNPLTALRTFGKLLLKRLRPGDANGELAEGILRESDRLQELLQQLDLAIDLNPMERLPQTAHPTENPAAWQTHLQSELRATLLDSELSPPPHPKPMLLPGAGADMHLEPHPVLEVLTPVLSSAGAIAQDRQLTLHVDIPADLPAVLIDTRALREVMSNLIDNALKYTPTNGMIWLRVARQLNAEGNSGQAIAIADTGPGISANDREHLFERHYRGAQAATDIPGTGLGLAIARELVLQMHGSIEVFSPSQPSDMPDTLSSEQTGLVPCGTVVVVWLPEA
ncbi:MAG TPA: HAMP domain-containing sensor histidine kinase [Chroococcidiopsis sp.]